MAENNGPRSAFALDQFTVQPYSPLPPCRLFLQTLATQTVIFFYQMLKSQPIRMFKPQNLQYSHPLRFPNGDRGMGGGLV